MRLFFAVPFGEEALGRLSAAQALLRQQAAQGRFSPRENLHLTLVFLGELPPSRLEALRRAAESVSFSPFCAEFDRIGCFSREGGSIWWAGLRPTPALLSLQRSLASALRREGVSLEERRFVPHVTLARQVKPDRLFPGGAPALNFSTAVESFALMESRREGGTLRYLPLLTRHAGGDCAPVGARAVRGAIDPDHPISKARDPQ